MLILEQSIDNNIIKKIITNPKLFKLIYGQETDLEHFKIDETCTYLLIKDEEIIIGCFQLKELTKCVIEAHIFILPKFCKTEYPVKSALLGHEWAKEKGYSKVFTKVPASCVHVMKFLNKLKYTVCGMITKGIVYNNQLMTLFFYEREI